MKRVEREAQWARHVEGWRKSGLTQPRYCERESISYDTFKRWRQRLGTGRGVRVATPRLVPVHVAPENAARRLPGDRWRCWAQPHRAEARRSGWRTLGRLAWEQSSMR